jgi:hypothetical protein
MFISMKVEIAEVRRSSLESCASALTATGVLAQELADLRKETSRLEAAPCAGQELNLTRRAQALRMRRRGESSATIAGALRLPRNEVELLLKVEAMAGVSTFPL